MNFQERDKPTTVTKALLSAVPYITINKDAIAKMFLYVKECSDEIGWLGTAYRSGKEILINDVFLFDQEVHATTTEITPEGLTAFATELLQHPDGMEIWNNMKVWGHSHVNMGITPSSQDDKQMEKFLEGGHDWFIRIIANKKGDLKVDLYDYESGLIYIDLPWAIQECEEELRLYMEIQKMQQELDAFREERVTYHETYVKEEIKTKVRKKTYGTVGRTYQSSLNTPMTPKVGGGNSTGVGLVSGNVKKNAPNANGNGTNASVTQIGRNADIDFFEDDDAVRLVFDWKTLLELSECRTLIELEVDLEEMGYYNQFTDDDLERILRVAFKTSALLSLREDR